MDNELLTILEQLERDKGIDKEILIAAVEAAVAGRGAAGAGTGRSLARTAKATGQDCMLQSSPAARHRSQPSAVEDGVCGHFVSTRCFASPGSPSPRISRSTPDA